MHTSRTLRKVVPKRVDRPWRINGDAQTVDPLFML